MDDETLGLLMYLDENLVKNLSSLLLSGYIEIRTTKLIQDRTLLGKAATDTREHNFGEDRNGQDEREGFRGSNCSNVQQYEVHNFNSAGLEDREFVRREEELKTIYTTFSLHSQIITNLKESKSVKDFDNITINEGDVSEGDYVKISGHLTTESVNAYLDALLTVFNGFGCDNLNKMLTTKSSGSMDFTQMNYVINHLSTILNANSTQDMILTCGDTPVILNVNNNNFLNSNAYIFDKVDCPCTVYGKVIRVAPNGECVSLLRKTGQHSFYENLLNNCCCPYCDMLTSNGIVVPAMPRLKCDGISLVIVPISISM